MRTFIFLTGLLAATFARGAEDNRLLIIKRTLCRHTQEILGNSHDPLVQLGIQMSFVGEKDHFIPVEMRQATQSEIGKIEAEVKRYVPSLDINILHRIFGLALENVSQHGKINREVAAELAITHTPDFVVVSIVNDLSYPFPNSLRGKAFSYDPKFRGVPLDERNTSFGGEGLAVELMVGRLRGLTSGDAGRPTMTWTEVTSPVDGKQKMLFRLSLPKENRSP